MNDRQALEQIRREQGITYEALGIRVGKSRNAVYTQLGDKVKQKHTMNLALLVEYADALGYAVVLIEKDRANDEKFVIGDFGKNYRKNRFARRREKLLAELEVINRELGEEQ